MTSKKSSIFTTLTISGARHPLVRTFPSGITFLQAKQLNISHRTRLLGNSFSSGFSLSEYGIVS